jgi:hypothetical protein
LLVGQSEIVTSIEMGPPAPRQTKSGHFRRFRATDVCPEVWTLLRDHPVPRKAFEELARMIPSRQAEAANLMIALNRYTAPYVQSLVVASQPRQLLPGPQMRMKGLSEEQKALMQRDSAELDEAVHIVAPFFGRDHLDLVVATAYVRRILQSQVAVAHLARHHSVLLSQLQEISLGL